MKLEPSIEAAIGGAAAAAAAVLCGQDDEANLVAALNLAHDRGGWEREVHYLCVAGTPEPEGLYRWMVAKERLLLPIDGWGSVDGGVQRFLVIFAHVAFGLCKLLAPPELSGKQVVPTQGHVKVEDTIFARDGRNTEQMKGKPGDPRSTADVPVTRIPDLPKPAPAAPAPPPLQISPAAAQAFVERKPPTPAEFQAMTPEERRPYAALFGMASFRDQEASGTLLDKPPAPAGKAELLRTTAAVGGEVIKGNVPVVRSAAHAKSVKPRRG